MHRHTWQLWGIGVLASFSVLEYRAYHKGKYRTLSRELRSWTASDRCPWSPLIFVAAGVAMAHHIRELKDLP